jgi:hypothetical protein
MHAMQWEPPLADPATQATLEAIEAICPPHTGMSWFKVLWEPGDSWQPIGRWIVWHMRPPGNVPRTHRTGLDGPHPRSTGHWCAAGWCACALKANAWHGAPASAYGIDRLTWELHQQTGCFGQRWWVVQGTNGGHRFKLDGLEAKLLKLHTGISDTPAAGDLPFAPLDARVLAHLRHADRVRLWKGAIAYAERPDTVLNATEQGAVEESRIALVRWMENQTDMLVDEQRSRLKRIIADVPRIPGFKDTTDYEREMEAFITAPGDMAPLSA